MVRGKLLVGLCLLAGSASVSVPAQAQESDSTGHILRLTIRGQVFEIDPPFQLFGNILGANLRTLVERIDEARDDATVSSLLLRLENPSASVAQRHALRRALLRFRRSGKPSYCFMEQASGADYLVASACNEVSMLPTGMMQIAGISFQLLYMKGLFDQLGIEFQELRMGRYKSAVESLTRKDPSPGQVEQMNSLVDALYEDLVAAVAENRRVSPLKVRSLVDQAMFTAREAHEAGLIDRLEYPDQFLARIRGVGDAQKKIVTAQTGRKLEFDISGFSGMIQLMNQILGGKKRRSSMKPKIALVYGVGPITTKASEDALFGGNQLTSEEMVGLLRKLREDTTVQAVVFRVNSPGGSAIASDLIRREVAEIAKVKPVVVSMGALAASGGYYISCPASWIVAESTTLTGSIGVIGAVANFRKLSDKLGLRFASFHRGKRADMISPYGELSAEGYAVIIHQLKAIYDDFITHVAAGRSLEPSAVEAIAEGRVWTGGQALRLGLVDEVGGLRDGLARARELAKLPEDIEVVVLPEPKQLIDILQRSGISLKPMRAFVEALPRRTRELLEQMAWVHDLTRERAFLAAPHAFDLRVE